MPTYLTPSEANVLVDAIEASLPAMYATVQLSDRHETFAAEANAILDLVEPQYQVALFERLESIVLKTQGFTKPPDAAQSQALVGLALSSAGHGHVSFLYSGGATD